MPATIHLNWPANPASESIVKYEVLASINGATVFSLIGSPTTNSFDIVNPTAGVYRFKVRAVNFVGTGPESPVADGPGIPTAPGTITVTVTP